MADVESPDDGSGAVQAEPTECCRCIYTCAMGLLFVALTLLSLHIAENFRPASKLLGFVAAVLVILASLLGVWFAAIFVLIATEWYHGVPEGEQRFVDGLILSDRGFLLESFRLYLGRIDDHHVDV